MSYLTWEEFKDVTIMPANLTTCKFNIGCGYVKGQLIDSSVRSIPTGYSFQPPCVKHTQSFDLEGIYGGGYFNHFGHFFVETLPRLWFAQRFPELPIIFTARMKQMAWQSEILEILDIKNEFIFITEPTLVKKIFFPFPLVHLKQYWTEDYFKSFGVFEGKGIVPGKKLFISRSKIIGRGYVNEKEIENYAISEGYEIFIPEEHSIKHRLHEISSSEKILMIEGSSIMAFSLIKNFSGQVDIIPRMADPDIKTLAWYLKMNYLDIIQKTVLSASVASLYEMKIEDLDHAIKNKKYLNPEGTMMGQESISKSLEIIKKYNQNPIDFIDDLQIAMFTKNEDIKIELLKKATQSFCDNEDCKRFQNIMLGDSIHVCNPFAMFFAYFCQVEKTITRKKDIIGSLIMLSKLGVFNLHTIRTPNARYQLALLLESNSCIDEAIKLHEKNIEDTVTPFNHSKESRKILIKLYQKTSQEIKLIQLLANTYDTVQGLDMIGIEKGTTYASYDICEALLNGLTTMAKSTYEKHCLEAALDRIKRAHDASINALLPKEKAPDNSKINIGAGVNWTRPGWLSLDKYASPGENVVVCDILHGDLPKIFTANSVEAIYSTHTLEHFTYAEATELLSDCLKIIKPGHPIRLVTPDLDICVDKLHNRDMDWWLHNEIQWHKDKKHLSDYQMSMNFLTSIGVLTDPICELRTLREVIRGTHFSAFNFSILEGILKKIGFTNIQKSKFDHSEFEYFEGLDNRETCSLYVEAIKPL